MKKILSKFFAILLISIILISTGANLVNGVFDKSDAYIEQIGEIDYHLKYYKEEKGMSTYCTCSIVGYKDNGKFYPAYCLNRDMHGVGSVENYSVDIDSVIDNNQVWRAVKNGYPYKTAGEMGLNSEYDAFAVTKFAIYCLIGQADINLYSADENDEEGQAMLNALHKLVDIGQNGNEKYTDEIKITKQGDFVEDGNYYTLTYKVVSSATIENYKIAEVRGLQEGDLLTDINGNIKTQFNSNENFKVKILKTNLNSNKDINIKLEANLKSYPLYYGKTRIAGTQNYLLTANTYDTISKEVNTKIDLNKGKIILNKVDAETKEPIENVEFELYNSSKKLLGNYKTDKNGKIQIENLFQGKYYLKEIKTNENYVLDENSQDYEVNVYYNKTSTITAENKRKKGNLEIKKVDKDNNEIPIENVGFELYLDKNLIGTYFTDKDGKIEIKDLNTGNYVLKEVSTNKWYNLAEDSNIEIKWKETKKVIVENELKKGQIKVIKVDKDNNEVKLEGVEFEVLDANSKVLEKIVTDKNGEAVTKEYPLRDYSILRLHETKTNEKYVLNEEIREVVLEENKIKDVIFENEKIKGKIKVVKKSQEDSELTGIKKDDPLEGVEFEIYNKDGKKIEELATNSEGIAITKELEKGTYKVKETKTNKWYLIDEKTKEVEIEHKDQIVTLNLKNMPSNPNEKIEKKGPDKAQKGEQIEYKINVENSGNVALENFIWEDVIPVEYIRLNKIKLGTYNYQGTYDIYYKTNFSNEYILFLEDISTKTNEEFDLSKEFATNEYITNIKLDFGTVQRGFKTENDTILYAKVLDTVKRDDVFENKVNLTGNYKGHVLNKNSSWKTIIYEILPLTGM